MLSAARIDPDDSESCATLLVFRLYSADVLSSPRRGEREIPLPS